MRKKIDIYVKDKDGVYQYACSTCYYKTLTEAKRRYYETRRDVPFSDIKCEFQKGERP